MDSTFKKWIRKKRKKFDEFLIKELNKEDDRVTYISIISWLMLFILLTIIFTLAFPFMDSLWLYFLLTGSLLPVYITLLLYKQFYIKSVYEKWMRREVPPNLLVDKAWQNIIKAIRYGQMLEGEESLFNSSETYYIFSTIRNSLFDSSHSVSLGTYFTKNTDRENMINTENAVLWLDKLQSPQMIRRISTLLTLDTQQKRDLFYDRPKEKIDEFMEPFKEFKDYMIEITYDENFRTKELRRLNVNPNSDLLKKDIDDLFDFSINKEELKLQSLDKDRDYILTVPTEEPPKSMKHMIDNKLYVYPPNNWRVGELDTTNLKTIEITDKSIRKYFEEHKGELNIGKYSFPIIDRRENEEPYLKVIYTYNRPCMLNENDILKYYFDKETIYVRHNNNFEKFDLSEYPNLFEWTPGLSKFEKELGFNPFMKFRRIEGIMHVIVAVDSENFVSPDDRTPISATSYTNLEYTSDIFKKGNNDEE